MIRPPLIPGDGEIAVLGLGRSGAAVTRLLRREGRAVYVSDSSSDAPSLEAADALRAIGAEADTGGHDLGRIRRASLVVASPGIPPDAEPLVCASQWKIPVVSEVEAALRFLDGVRVIAITGTNGKSTTTAMIAHLLEAIGVRARAAGNIGTALSEVALEAELPQWVALELSSFQLHDTPSIAPDVGVLTNLAPDHLDRYESAAAYFADKELLFRNASPESIWVLNGDDERVMRMGSGVPGRAVTFGSGIGHDARSGDGWLTVLGERILARDDLPLLGEHNVANALAASLAVMIAAEEFRTPSAIGEIACGLRSFGGLPHRLEVVADVNGVRWINDSKATNVASTLVAVEGMKRPVILLLGGRHKGEPYTRLIPAARGVVRKILAYGEAAETITGDLGSTLDVEMLGSDFPAVVERARALAQRGDTVLLSPACSSFDMFENYEVRGARFAALARRRSSLD